MRKNHVPKPVNVSVTHGGARADVTTGIKMLTRSVMACLLWEKQFYESGESNVARIKRLVPECDPRDVAKLAVKARTEYKLRHVPLLLAREMARYPKHKAYVSDLLPQIILRADEIAEFMAIYYEDDPNQPLANSVKRGLAMAFNNFDAYSFAKYNRDGKFSLRDVMFLVHPDPSKSIRTVNERFNFKIENPVRRKNYKRDKVLRHNSGIGLTFRQIAEDNLPVPDTWEVALSADDGLSKREKWERLIREDKLGDLAILRNIRNMEEAGVSQAMIVSAIGRVSGEKILPSQFLAAMRSTTLYKRNVEHAMFRGVAQYRKLSGKTIFIVDVSGSMDQHLSSKSDLTRKDAACALMMIGVELSESAVVYATGGSDSMRVHSTVKIEGRGIDLDSAIRKANRTTGLGGIFLKQVMDYVAAEEHSTADRIIVITDEQDTSNSLADNPRNVKAFAGNFYVLNVGTYEKSIAEHHAVHVHGFSEAVYDYIAACEAEHLFESGNQQ